MIDLLQMLALIPMHDKFPEFTCPHATVRLLLALDHDLVNQLLRDQVVYLVLLSRSLAAFMASVSFSPGKTLSVPIDLSYSKALETG